MKLQATNIEAQKKFSEIYQLTANYLGQPQHVKMFISRKLFNIDGFIFTIEQLISRLTVIRILEDTDQMPVILNKVLEKHRDESDEDEQIWNELLDLFLELRIAMQKDDDNQEGVWTLSGVDELHLNNKLIRQIIIIFNDMDFSEGLLITSRLDMWISEMSKALRGGLESSIEKKPNQKKPKK